MIFSIFAIQFVSRTLNRQTKPSQWLVQWCVFELLTSMLQIVRCGPFILPPRYSEISLSIVCSSESNTCCSITSTSSPNQIAFTPEFKMLLKHRTQLPIGSHLINPITSKSKKYFRPCGMAPSEWTPSVRALRDILVADHSIPVLNTTRRVAYHPLIGI